LYARHPGTRGKHTWARRKKMLSHSAGRTFNKAMVDAVERVF
jgi:hypothetical protein